MYVRTQLAMRLFSRESVEAVKTIRSILQNFHNEHGVVDIFHRGYKTHDIIFSVYALSRLQSAAMVYEQQQQRRREESSPAFDSQNDPADRQLLQDLAHYVVYANAVYGWKMDLALRLRLHVGGDIQALLRRTGVQPEDVVVAEWESRTHRPAYFVVRDHRKRSIVLAVRGTWSPHDLLTDLCCLPQDFECESMPRSNTTTAARKLSAVFSKPARADRRCGHHGMLEAAKAVHSDVNDTLRREMNDHPDYALVLVGHSLGAGVAALLSCLLEQQFPDLRVFLYGAPCAVPAGARLHDNIVSVISEGDPFCRLSLGHVADISHALALLCEDPMLRHDILLRTSQQDMAETDLEWCYHEMQTLRSKMTAEKLFPPGRILLLTPATASLLQPRKSPLSADGGDELPSLRHVPMDHFRDLVIGPRMLDLSKHIPSLYEKNLRVLANGGHNDDAL